MASVLLKDVCKIYPSRDKKSAEGVLAVDKFNIEIQDNEFIVFVGPSGCGKSTTLRMIAGLEDISSGELYIDGKYMNNTEPKNRDISMVFQNYALYPHMTAYENIGFGLTLRRVAEPVYEESEYVSAHLSEITEISTKNQEIFEKLKANDKTLLAVRRALKKQEEKLTNINDKIAAIEEQEVKSVSMLNKLDKLKTQKTTLENSVMELNEKIAELEKTVLSSREQMDSNDMRLNELRGELAPYQKQAIDEKSVAEQSENLAYYENLAKTDEDRRVADEQFISEANGEIKNLSEGIDAFSTEIQSDKVTKNKIYKLSVKREKLQKSVKIYEKELEILAARKVTIEKRIAESREKLEFYKTNVQPVYNYRKYTKFEIDRKIKAASDILGIEELLNRKPREMSGGQRQRIALGRAIVREPKVFLLDEPLSNLDAKLRATMRVEISRLHEKLKTTFIYVTHDQIEAMTMGTRIVVMKDGVIQQIDTPTNLFDYPENIFVAGFIGTPRMNFFDVKIKTTPEQIHITFKDGYVAKYSKNSMRTIKTEYDDGNEHACVLGIRGEHMSLAKSGIFAILNDMEILGSETHLHLDCNNAQNDVILKSAERLFAKDQPVCLAFDESKIHLFDAQTQETVLLANTQSENK